MRFSILILYKCGVLFIWLKVFQNLYTDKRTAPHFLFVKSAVGAGAETRTVYHEKIYDAGGLSVCGVAPVRM